MRSLVLVGVPSASTAAYEKMPRAMRRDWPLFAERSAAAICRGEHSTATLAWLGAMFGGTALPVALETVAVLGAFEPAEVAAQVAAPTLFVHGERDDVVPLRVSQECAARMPGPPSHPSMDRSPGGPRRPGGVGRAGRGDDQGSRRNGQGTGDGADDGTGGPGMTTGTRTGLMTGSSLAETDVLVVGLGPVGSTLAGLLGRRGVRVIAVDREPKVFALPRAAHVDHMGLRTFQELGLLDQLLPDMIPNPGLDFVTADRRLLMRIPGDQQSWSGLPASMYFHQPRVDRALRAQAAATPGVEIRLGVGLADLVAEPDAVVTSLVRAGEVTRVRAGGWWAATAPTAASANLPA